MPVSLKLVPSTLVANFAVLVFVPHCFKLNLTCDTVTSLNTTVIVPVFITGQSLTVPVCLAALEKVTVASSKVAVWLE